MPSRLCLEPTCPEPATFRGRCTTHQRDRQRQINRAGNRIYNTKRWRRTRERVLSEQPLCQCGAIAEHVHHITDLVDGGDPWNPDNLQALCAPCHSRITRQRQRQATETPA